MTQKKRRGFTLTEIAIVLGILGMITGGIWIAANKVHRQQRVNAAVVETLNIVNILRGLYPSGTIMGGAQNLGISLINSGKMGTSELQSCTGLPRWGGWMGNGTTCIVDPWEGQVSVGAQTGWGFFPSSIHEVEILFEADATHGMEDCAAFLGALVPAAVNDGLVAVSYDTGAGNIIYVNQNTSLNAFAGCATNGGEIDLQFKL